MESFKKDLTRIKICDIIIYNLNYIKDGEIKWQFY